jgi:hypothetical protein
MSHTEAEVQTAVDELWASSAERELVHAALSEYGVAQHEREVARVRLAILRLSAGQIDRVKELVAVAKRDYRDVLMWAEYPEEGQSLWTASTQLSPAQRAELGEIRRRDQRQHAEWLADLRRRTGR